jgi:hypothetical protein
MKKIVIHQHSVMLKQKKEKEKQDYRKCKTKHAAKVLVVTDIHKLAKKNSVLFSSVIFVGTIQVKDQLRKILKTIFESLKRVLPKD